MVGAGNLDLPGLAAALDDIGFDGSLILEGEVDNPLPALRAGDADRVARR